MYMDLCAFRGAFLLPVDNLAKAVIKYHQQGGGTMVSPKSGLTGNQLKILAMLAMTCDHVGVQMFPHLLWLRIIGRLAMPVYGFMIAEGCRHTRDRKKYFLRLFAMGLLCQVVYFVAMGSLYQCILMTFSLSVCLICLLDMVEREKSRKNWGKLLAGTLLVFFLCVVLPDLLPHTDFQVDYGLAGVLLPVLIYGAGTRGLLLGLFLLAMQFGSIQWFAFGAVPLLLAYNGQRGKANIGKLFYWYYPVHLVVIYGISLFL